VVKPLFLSAPWLILFLARVIILFPAFCKDLMMKTWKIVGAVLAVSLLGMDGLPGQEAPKKPAAGTLVVIDASGKEQTLTSWKFLEGTRHLPWLVPAEAPGEESKPAKPGKPGEARAPAGPEVLEVRAVTKLTYAEGVLTWIPLTTIREIRFDSEAGTMTVQASDRSGEPVSLVGTTRYRGINKITLQAEVDKGALGVAEIRFFGGIPKGIQGIRFPEGKPPAAPAAGEPAVVVCEEGRGKTDYPVANLQALYRREGAKPGEGEEVSSLLYFKKTLKIDMKLIKTIVIKRGAGPVGNSWHVTTRKGEVDEALSLLQKVMIDGKPTLLTGLVGTVPVGYQFFPLSAITEIRFGADAKPSTNPGEEKP
jgi:hypothetical protein